MQPTHQALFDSHCHLQDDRLPGLQHLLQEAAAAGVTGMSCNGCWQEDWERVAALAAAAAELQAAASPTGSDHQQPTIILNFGLHPWWVPRRSPDWLQRLRRMLEAHPSAGLGEVGNKLHLGSWWLPGDLSLTPACLLYCTRRAFLRLCGINAACGHAQPVDTACNQPPASWCSVGLTEGRAPPPAAGRSSWKPLRRSCGWVRSCVGRCR